MSLILPLSQCIQLTIVRIVLQNNANAHSDKRTSTWTRVQRRHVLLGAILKNTEMAPSPSPSNLGRNVLSHPKLQSTIAERSRSDYQADFFRDVLQ